MAKQIPLTQGKFALVSNEDYEMLAVFKWSFHGKYAHRVTSENGKQTHHYMHRVIAGTPKGMDTDHINGERLDNRRENLRICTRSQNNMNMGVPSHNTSGYRGVSWDKRAKKWQARIVINRKLVYCVRFEDKMSAVKAHATKSKDLFGEFIKVSNLQETK